MVRMTVLLAVASLLLGCQGQSSTESPASTATAAATTTTAALPAEPAREWAPEAFDEASGHTTPIDQMAFLSSLAKSEERNRKGDFETTAEYKARTKDLAQLIAPINPDAEYLFAPHYNDVEYDADAQRYKGMYTTACYTTFFDDGLVSCEFGQQAQNVRSYVGKNGFGATADVTETNGTSINLVMSDSAARKYRSKSGYDFELPNECPMPIADAKGIGATGLGFAYLFKVSGAHVESGDMIFDEATVQSPERRIFERKGIHAKLTGLVCYRRSDAKIVHVKRFS